MGFKDLNVKGFKDFYLEAKASIWNLALTVLYVPYSLDSGPAVAQLLHRDCLRFRGGLVFKAHRLCVSLNSRLERMKEEEESRSSFIEIVCQEGTP